MILRMASIIVLFLRHHSETKHQSIVLSFFYSSCFKLWPVFMDSAAVGPKKAMMDMACFSKLAKWYRVSETFENGHSCWFQKNIPVPAAALFKISVAIFLREKERSKRPFFQIGHIQLMTAVFERHARSISKAAFFSPDGQFWKACRIHQHSFYNFYVNTAFFDTTAAETMHEKVEAKKWPFHPTAIF